MRRPKWIVRSELPDVLLRGAFTLRTAAAGRPISPVIHGGFDSERVPERSSPRPEPLPACCRDRIVPQITSASADRCLGLALIARLLEIGVPQQPC